MSSRWLLPSGEKEAEEDVLSSFPLGKRKRRKMSWDWSDHIVDDHIRQPGHGRG